VLQVTPRFCEDAVMAAAAGVDEYIAGQPAEVQEILQEVRGRIRTALPGSGEKISYGMPAVVLDGRALFYYGAWKAHLGLYPLPKGDDELEQAVSPYRATKDTLRFRYRDPIPYDLIVRIATAIADRAA
jgi:uncharacterized protein YdhG (YjbR/CyaY superfamily)